MPSADTSDPAGRIKHTTEQAQKQQGVPLVPRTAEGRHRAGPDVGRSRRHRRFADPASLGLHEGFWGSITAIAVVQAELSATQSSARDQFTWAAIGGAISALISTIAGEHLPAYVVALVLSMLACWLLNVSTAARLAGSTVTIIMLVPHGVRGGGE